MTEIVKEPGCSPIAAILYRAEDDVDTLLSDFALDRLRGGDRLGGIVQRNIKNAEGKKVDMQLIDLMTGRAIGISQTLGGGAASCKLDAGGLAESAQAVRRAVENAVDLVVINKFSKQEAGGHGLRDEFGEAIVAGLPLLTAVPEKCAEAWRDFTGDQAVTLPCARDALDAWWRDLSAGLPGRARSATEAGAEDRDWLWQTIC